VLLFWLCLPALGRDQARLRSHSAIIGQISCCDRRLAMIRAWV
jgi:hypothetical protein